MTEDQKRIFIAAADRILPGSAGPGATEAHVVGFLENLWHQPVFRQKTETFSRGFVLLQDFAQTLCGRNFIDCCAADRDMVLRRLEAIPHPTARGFLVSLVRVTLSGYLCHPDHGGNRDEIAWKAFGISYDRQPTQPGEIS